MQRIPHQYSTYSNDDLKAAWEAQGRNLKFWEAKGEAGRVSAEDCRTAMKRIEAILERRGALPAYMQPAMPRRLP